MLYPSRENKGANQLRNYCEADLRLCFRLCRLLDFTCGGSDMGFKGYTFHGHVFLMVNLARLSGPTVAKDVRSLFKVG